MIEQLTPIILKKILPKLITTAAKYGVDKLKKTPAFTELLHELGHRKPDDDFESIYLHSVVLYSASGNKEEEIIKLFLEDEVKKAFLKAYKTNDSEGFEREINHQLHVNPLVRNIKDWDKIPADEITAFKDTFKKLNHDVLSPSDALIFNEIKDNKDLLSGGFANQQEILEKILSTVSSNNTGDISEELNKEFKAQLDEYKVLVDTNKIDAALQGLLKIKERNWSKFNNQTKYRVLTNIGICYLRKDEQNECAKFFIEALEFKSEDKVAISNAAIGYLYIDEIDKAVALADKIDTIDPNSFKALAIRIRAKKIEGEELVQLLAKSENNSNEDILVAAVNHYVTTQNYELAEQHCKKLLDISSEIIFKEFYIQIVTNLYATQNHIVVKDLNGAVTAPVISNAISLCDECWQYYFKTDLRSNKAFLLVHKSMLLHLLGKDEEALLIVTDALKEKENDPYFLKHKGLFLASLNRHAEAITVFNQIKEKLEVEELPILLGTSYYWNQQKAEAMQVLGEELKEEFSASPFNKNALLLLIHVYKKDFNSIDREKAEKDIETIIKRYPDDVAILADSSGYFYETGNIEKANEYLEKALKIIQSTKVSTKNLFIVSGELRAQGRYEDAIKIDEAIIDVDQNNYLTHNLAKLYYISGKRNKALEIYQNLRTKYGVIEGITKHEVRIYQETGDIEKAKDIATQYVAKFNDVNAKIVLNGLNIRLENYDEVKASLNSPMNYFELDLYELRTLLAQMFKMDMTAKALDIAYEVKRLNETLEYNDFYASAIFSKHEKQNDEYLNIDKVRANCAVFLKEKSGNIFHVILEEREEKELKAGEINRNFPLFNEVLGKQRGDVVMYSNRYTPETVEIVDIKHKYIHVFHESLEKIATIYRGRSLFTSIDSSELLEGQLPEFIKKQLQEGEAQQKRLQDFKEQYYKTHRCTLGTIASFTNTHPIKVWNNLIRDDRVGVQVCLGENNEIQTGTELLNSGKRLCFDFISLITLYQLEEIREKVIGRYNKIKISQSVSDLLNEFITEEEAFGDGESSEIFSRGGQNYLISKSADEKKQQMAYLSGFKQWIKDNCEIEPCQLILNYSDEKVKEYNKILGESFFETCLLAKEHDYLLISEDYAFRLLCKTDFDIDGVWGQVILVDLLKNEQITSEQYHKALQTFVNHNYRHTSIDANTLFFTIKESNWTISDSFRKLTKIFYGNYSSSNAIIVAVQFLSFLWNDQNPSIEQKRQITRHIISDYLTERTLLDHIIRVKQTVKIVFEKDRTIHGEIMNELIKFGRLLDKWMGEGYGIF